MHERVMAILGDGHVQRLAGQRNEELALAIESEGRNSLLGNDDQGFFELVEEDLVRAVPGGELCDARFVAAEIDQRDVLQAIGRIRDLPPPS